MTLQNVLFYQARNIKQLKKGAKDEYQKHKKKGRQENLQENSGKHEKN